ncbi:MAG: hypothetical protein KIT16_15320 [Rhodospirillaceae bacterium]|nr:hypothetical protein [Rhodospirillaceae bacterium]
MIKLLAIAATATAIAVAATPASAVTDLWALKANGSSAHLKGFASKTRVFSAEEHKHLNAGLKKTYSQRKVFCNQEFMLSTAQVRWLSVHTKAKHRVVLRERLPKGKFRNVC